MRTRTKIIIIVAGCLLVAALMLSVYMYAGGKGASDALMLSRAMYLADWAERAYKACEGQPPETCIWAMSSFIDVQEKFRASPNDDTTNSSLVKCHVVLAMAYKETGNAQLYEKNIKAAQSISKESLNQEISEEKLIEVLYNSGKKK